MTFEDGPLPGTVKNSSEVRGCFHLLKSSSAVVEIGFRLQSYAKLLEYSLYVLTMNCYSHRLQEYLIYSRTYSN